MIRERLQSLITWIRGSHYRIAGLIIALGIAIAAIVHVVNQNDSAPTTSWNARAQRRAYHGAPPIIPHQPFGANCISCHADSAAQIPGIGIAPANPHLTTSGMSAGSNCRQCHVHQATATVFAKSTFTGSDQNWKPADRMYPKAPPVVPHRIHMRENCKSCHTGLAARAEIRCSHPDRTHCLQCHALSIQSSQFRR